MCWRRCDVRSAGYTGAAVGVNSSLRVLRGSQYTNSATDACRSALNAVRIPRRAKGGAYCPIMVCMAHDGCLKRPVQVFHESFGYGVVGGCSCELNATLSGEGTKELTHIDVPVR
jgi:hypothetical protein